MTRVPAVIAVLVTYAACSGAPPAKEPARPPAKCASVADHLLELMPAANAAPADDLDAMRRLFNAHCRDDGWSAQAQDCMLAASSLQDVGGRCAEKLTPEQTAALGTAIESAHGESAPSDAGIVVEHSDAAP
jgi:hypothetical protein